jgi:MFS family permease
METAPHAPTLPTARIARWTLVASILGSSMAFVDGSVVNVALPAIQHDLGGGWPPSSGSWTRTSSTLGSLILVGGSLGDIYGEFRIFALGVAGFAVASVLCALAPDATTLIVFAACRAWRARCLTLGVRSRCSRRRSRAPRAAPRSASGPPGAASRS